MKRIDHQLNIKIDRWKKISDKVGIKEIIKIYFSKDIKKAKEWLSKF
ncbi:MAG: hypothetical protein ACE5J9_10920 [Methanosarcinales archaeon]